MTMFTFDSTEEMIEFLRERAAEAHAGMADAQRGITFGDKWIRYIGEGQAEFGHVLPIETIAMNGLESGESWADVVEYVAHVGNRFSQGFLTGIASSALDDEEHGETHKHSVWPIEDRLYDAAKAVDWDVTRLDEAMRLLVRIAFAQQHAHEVALAAEGGKR